MLHFIYILRDPRTNEIRYVGRTNDTAERLRGHISYTHACPKTTWIAELKAEGKKPIMQVVDSIEGTDDPKRPGDQVCDLERLWIANMLAIGCHLLNTMESTHEAIRQAHVEYPPHKPTRWAARLGLQVGKLNIGLTASLEVQ